MKKFYSMYQKAVDSDGNVHYVTVVGQFEQRRERKTIEEVIPVYLSEKSTVEGVIVYPSNKILTRKLTLGVSICHPLDEFDKEKGEEIAKSRIKRGDVIGSLETNDVTMLTEDAIMAEIFTKLMYIAKNIDDYIEKD